MSVGTELSTTGARKGRAAFMAKRNSTLNYASRVRGTCWSVMQLQMSLIPAPSTITSGRFALHGIARLTDDCQGYWNGYGYDPAALDDSWLMGSRIRHRRVGSR